MNDKQRYEMIVGKLDDPVACYKDGKKWRWFVMIDAEWKETNKHCIGKAIWDALPERQQTPNNVVSVIHWYKFMSKIQNSRELINNGLL